MCAHVGEVATPLKTYPYSLVWQRTEPFGYVDVEYAWHGTVTVGATVGGLGKVPG